MSQQQPLGPGTEPAPESDALVGAVPVHPPEDARQDDVGGARPSAESDEEQGDVEERRSRPE